MQLEQIKTNFIKFFEQKGHKYSKSSPIVIKDDPTLMFTNAGMNQFKQYFKDPQEAPNKRVVNIQPCLRVSGKHNDIEEVGVDTYHHTMFEMMGTWSFGDYFKEDAIKWAWELITKVFGIEEDRIYVSVFGGDKEEGLEKDVETCNIWSAFVKPEYILDNCSKRDNFWEMGDTGPCGPCTEIHVDIRSDIERLKIPGKLLVNKDHPEVIEIWNIVFIQYARLANGNLINLGAKHIDTGMGLERLAMVLQKKQSNYDTDIFAPLLNSISKLADKPYGQDQKTDIAMRVIVDHIRAVAFCIADGQVPSNIKAGYVIRRILRRAIRYGYSTLGLKNPFMYKLVEVLAVQVENFYPNIYAQKDHIAKIIRSEEESFLKTLASGVNRLEKIIEELSLKKEKVLPGKLAFEMYDTYGFPLDLTVLIAKENSLSVDVENFEIYLSDQKKRSKGDAKVELGDWEIVDEANATTAFVGYERLECEAKILQYRKVVHKEEVIYQIILNKTPFYPEGGGQVGDTGKLICGDEELEVTCTRRENELLIHEIKTLPGNIHRTIVAIVDAEKRMKTSNNHTATHLLNASLRKILGGHVEQRGSLVNEKFLRFDFSHNEKISPEALTEIESLINAKIRENILLEEMSNVPIKEALARNVVAVFGEKYGESVRIITIEKDFSKELCGGTHARRTGNIGLFKIKTCTSVAAGVRRIEAVTGGEAENYIGEQLLELRNVRTQLNGPVSSSSALEKVLYELKGLKGKVRTYEEFFDNRLIDDLAPKIMQKTGYNTLVAEIGISEPERVKALISKIKIKYGDMRIILLTKSEAKIYIAAWVDKCTLDKSASSTMSAQDVASKFIQLFGGKGGGNETFANVILEKTPELDFPQILNIAGSIF